MSIYHFSFTNPHLREKSSTVTRCESGFTPEGAMRKTAGLSHTPKEIK